MRTIIHIVFAVIVGIAVITAAYYQRGYIAIGAEYAVPILLLVALFAHDKGEKRDEKDCRR